jgi:aminoglycoside phosphotransferase (APT) family kinase protein
MSVELQAKLRVYSYVKFDYYDQVKIQEMNPISSNPESSVYRFNLWYEDKGVSKTDELILKTFANDMYGKDHALKERHALKQLHFRGYPVPRPVASETEAGHIGMPFIIMERIPGRLLGNVLLESPEVEQPKLLTPFVQLLVDLHTMNIKALVENLLVKDEYTLIKRELYNLRSLIAPYESLTPIFEWLNEHRDRVPCARPSINHRDFHPWNVILSDEGKLSVIDWGWQIGDPRSDLAWLLTKLERENLGRMSDIVLREYERLDGRPVEHLDYFKVLANLRWLVGVAKDFQVDRSLQNGAGEHARAELLPRIANAVVVIENATGLGLPKADELMSVFKGS